MDKRAVGALEWGAAGRGRGHALTLEALPEAAWSVAHVVCELIAEGGKALDLDLLLECAAYSAARATLRAVVAEHCGDVALSLPLLLGSSAGPRGVRVAIADAVAAFVRQCGRALLMSPSLVLALG